MAVWIKVNKEDISLEEVNELFNNPTNKFDIHYFDGTKGNYYEIEVRGFEEGQEKQAKKELFKQLKNLRKQVQTMKLTDLEQIEYNGEQYLVVYKAQQYRWENSNAPEVDDVKYFIDENQAKVYAEEEILLNIGFESQVESRCLDTSSLSQEDWEREFDSIEEIVNEYNFDDYVETQTIDYNEGKDITGAVVVEWNWEKYPGYCRNLTDIGIAGEGNFYSLKKESNLITGNEEDTWHKNYSLLLTKEEIKEFSEIYQKEDSLKEVLYEKLYDSGWQWNDFGHNPNSKQIRDKICKLGIELKGVFAFIEKENGEKVDISNEIKNHSNNWELLINGKNYEGRLITNVFHIQCDSNLFSEIKASEARSIRCEDCPNLEEIAAPNCVELFCEGSPLLKEENIEVAYDCEIEGLEKKSIKNVKIWI